MIKRKHSKMVNVKECIKPLAFPRGIIKNVTVKDNRFDENTMQEKRRVSIWQMLKVV